MLPAAPRLLALVHQEQSGYSSSVLAGALERFACCRPGTRRSDRFVFTVLAGAAAHLDWCLSAACQGPAKGFDPLWCARCCVWACGGGGRYRGTPAAVAVSEAVVLAQSTEKSSAAGLVNAVLRRALEQHLEQAQFADEAERFSVLYRWGCRPWLLLREYPAQCEKNIAGLLLPPQPPGALRCNTLRTDARAVRRWRGQGAGGRAARRGAGALCGQPGRYQSLRPGALPRAGGRPRSWRR